MAVILNMTYGSWGLPQAAKMGGCAEDIDRKLEELEREEVTVTGGYPLVN